MSCDSNGRPYDTPKCPLYNNGHHIIYKVEYLVRIHGEVSEKTSKSLPHRQYEYLCNFSSFSSFRW